MATPFRPIELTVLPSQTHPQEPEADYWSKYKDVAYLQLRGAVTTLEFAPAGSEPLLAATSSAGIDFVDTASLTIQRSLTKFRGAALSGRFRDDGKLLVAGGEDPAVKVFNVASRSLLRILKGHAAPVRAADFMADKIHVISGSDDGTLKTWDVSTRANVSSIHAHTDSIRALCNSTGTPAIWATGSYDHNVKVWDMRNGSAVMTLNHGAPVETVMYYPSGGVLVSAGGNYVRLWDILGGGVVLHEMSNHQKTITSLCLDASGKRLFTGGLDHFIKVHDAHSYGVMYTFTGDAPILSLAIAPDDSLLVAGMSDGVAHVRRRTLPLAAIAQEKAKQKPRPGTVRYFLRGADAPSKKGDFVIPPENSGEVVRGYNKMLKEFRHKDALDFALKSRDTIIIVSVLHELIHRDSLQAAVSGRDEINLEPLLTFLSRTVTDPRYSTVLVPVLETVLGLIICIVPFSHDSDLYAPVIGSSITIDKLLIELKKQLKSEVELQEKMLKVLGALDMVMSSSETGVQPTVVAQGSPFTPVEQ